MQWDPRATRTAGELLGTPVCGTFQNRKSFESEWERALMRNFTDLTIFPPWLSWLKFFFFSYFSLFLENFIEWDLWSNIFKFLSNIWFCTSPHVWAGFWQYFGRGWKQGKTKYALFPTCFGCQASDVLGQSGPFSPASSDLLLTVTQHRSQFPLHSFPVYSQESPEWHTQSPDLTDHGSLGLGMACNATRLMRHSGAADRERLSLGLSK